MDTGKHGYHPCPSTLKHMCLVVVRSLFPKYDLSMEAKGFEPGPLSSTGRNLYPVAVSQVGCIVTKTIVKSAANHLVLKIVI